MIEVNKSIIDRNVKSIYIEGQAFAFTSPNDLREVKVMAVMNFPPTNFILNSRFK